ncbi:hypothetical protein BD324DRAFT_648197 [Kockovaella imperatae]|uniref:Glycoside hydrolase superfamily n=1 Tax=Kockovaella imperatae TaxID=4999 RepID=A0A1Y1UQ22_9TREE|nr:hypothetical protein BD324DRAFT_648197 [Kockovaella imperatae]ORX39556.1 hypothetical protein BD324DRAFT_648197 [Kockovaella imperatae]
MAIQAMHPFLAPPPNGGLASMGAYVSQALPPISTPAVDSRYCADELLVGQDEGASFGTWCGKYYQVGAPQPTARPEGSLFDYPPKSEQPLFDFQCTTKSSIYIEGDDHYDPPMILVDTNITHDIGQPYHSDWSSKVRVDVWVDNDHYLGGDDFVMNTLGNLIPFNVSSLKAGSTKHNLTCKAQVHGQVYYTTSTLTYLPPNPYGGNTVKIDRKTQALLVRNETSGDKAWQTLIPFGYYDSYNTSTSLQVCGNSSNCGEDARSDTLNRLRMAKDLGFNLVHTVPPGGFYPYTFDAEATAQFEEYISTAESLGLYIQYDMRNSFKNLSSVAYQIDYLRNRSNILLWYSGDEPDGAVDPIDSTKLAYETIYTHDGYHPVSLVLNCENYFFEEYALQGSDIIMVDPYSIALNAAWSKTYNTIVTENFGVSGCDGCVGNFYDISNRVEASRDRARLRGQWRNKPTWIVPQSFDDAQLEFWYRAPYGSENACNNILGWNHGAQGSVAWNSQYSTQELLRNSSAIAHLVFSQRRFLLEAYETRRQILSDQPYPGMNGIDIASWTIEDINGTGKTERLIMAVNAQYGRGEESWTFGLQDFLGTVKEVLYGNVAKGPNGEPVFMLPRTSVAAVILEE